MALPKAMRLKGHRSFNYIHKNSEKFYGKLMTLKIAKSNPNILLSHNHIKSLDNIKIAIAISKKVSKKAVIRNKIRRMLQEYLLENFCQKNNHRPYWILVILKSADFHNDKFVLLNEFQHLIFKSGLFK